MSKHLASSSGTPDFRRIFDRLPGSFAILTPDFRIVAASDGYLRNARMRSEELLGRNIFEAFPGNIADPNNSGPENLRRSIEHVLATREPHTMPVQRYEIPSTTDGGRFEEKYWST